MNPQAPTKVVGRRVAAYLIDVLILSAIGAISWYLLTKNVSEGTCLGGGVTINGKCRGFTAGSSNRAVWIVILAVAWIGILVVMQGLTGKTPGKAAMGINVVNAEGKPPGMGRAFLRELLWIVDSLPFLNLVGFITALSTQRNQRVGDMAASTYVIDKNALGAFAGGQPGGGQVGGGQFAPPSGSPAYGSPPPQGAAPAPPQQEAAWYPDPHGQARLRYWDGDRWTDHTSA